MRKILLVGAALAAMTLAGCNGKTVDPGNEGIKIKAYGSDAGVQHEPLGVGWHYTSFGEKIVEYPTITRNYSWTRETNKDSPVNEEFQFNDSTGLPLTADIQTTLAIQPSKVADIYTKYRLDFPDLLDGPIRAYVRTAVAREASNYTSEQLYTNGRQEVIAKALGDVQKHFEGTGVIVSDLQWLGSFRFPQSVTDAIVAKTTADQSAQVAERQVAQAKAQSEIKVAEAEGDAKSMQIRGDALRANPQLIQQQWVQRWNGVLPQYVTGGGQSYMLVQPK